MNKKFQFVNLEQIEDIAGGDLGFQKELITIFLEQIPEFVTNISTFYKEQKLDALAREAHTAKSSALTFGMEETGVLLKQIQLHAEANETELLADIINKALSQLQAAVAELEKIKQDL